MSTTSISNILKPLARFLVEKRGSVTGCRTLRITLHSLCILPRILEAPDATPTLRAMHPSELGQQAQELGLRDGAAAVLVAVVEDLRHRLLRVEAREDLRVESTDAFRLACF